VQEPAQTFAQQAHHDALAQLAHMPASLEPGRHRRPRLPRRILGLLMFAIASAVVLGVAAGLTWWALTRTAAGSTQLTLP